MDDLSKLKNILIIGKEVLAAQDIDQVLKKSMDKLITLSGAERGFIVLFDKAGNNLFQTARNLEKSDIERPEFEISRTIIEQSRSEKKPVYLHNALEEPSLNNSKSVDELKILSVICLPLLHEGKVFGVIYLDNRTVRGAFSPTTFHLVENFADFISLAAYHALERKTFAERQHDLERQLRDRYDFQEIIGRSPQMMDVLKMISHVAETHATVLIEGESGTGKELAARAIHFNSPRRDKPLVCINCGAFPENLLESEFFGHEKGAFTGAMKRHRGKFELADGGTLFLDEIHTMSPALQVKLLRILQTGEFTPLGSETTLRCNVRIVAAAKPDLKQLVDKGAFREDLYYRLNVIRIKMPPLRQRRDDILPLAEYFLERAFAETDKPVPEVSDEVKQILTSYDYPGNVRELENIIQRAAILSRGQTIDVHLLPDEVRLATPNHVTIVPDTRLTFKDAKEKMVANFEKQYLLQALAECNGAINKAAELAGMHTKNFHEKMVRYNIQPKKEFR